jgi:large subunit ribosomal protein L21
MFMSTFAVITTGGKQYLVREGQELKVEKLELETGATFDLDALLVSDEEGAHVTIGTPTISGAKVTVKVLEEGRARKVPVIKYKPKSRYRRNVGHRQPFTKIKIEKIAAS